jgi:type IV fimbrial biogenesis protein FimT
LVANSTSAPPITGGVACSLPTGTPPRFTYNIQLTGQADHPLQVQVALGGQVHLCDPSQTLSSTNTYGC